MQKLEIMELNLIGFGKFRNKTISFASGLNLLEGENEAGKSTIQSFIMGMFYGFYQAGAKRRTHLSQWEKYQPWDGGSYRGVMVCKNQERTFRIERSFEKDNEEVSIYDNDTGEDLTASFPYHNITRQPQVGEMLLGMSRTSFANTASIAQLGCGSVSQESAFSAEVNDRMLSVMQTADSSISMSAVLQELDWKADQVGSPKKSRTPYGKAVQKERELTAELALSRQNEEDYRSILRQSKKITEEIKVLQKKKSILENQVKESAAKEMGGRFLKAQNLITRIKRMEKEQEQLSVYQNIDLEIIDQAQNSIGAKAQLGLSMKKYQQAQEELTRKLADLKLMYSRLEVCGASSEQLDQFDLMLERYLSIKEQSQELHGLRIQQNKLRQHNSKAAVIEEKQLAEDIAVLREMDHASVPDDSRNSWTLPVIACGFAISAASGTWLLLSSSKLLPLLTLLSGILFLIFGFLMRSRKSNPLHKEQNPQVSEIMNRYQLHDEENPLSCLQETLGKIQLNNYKVQQYREQEQRITQEIQLRAQKVQDTEKEILQYLYELTEKKRRENPYIQQEPVQLGMMENKAIRAEVAQAKRLAGEMQTLTQQLEQNQQDQTVCRQQQEEVSKAISLALEACAEAGAQSVEDLERCRQGRQRYRDVSMELQMQRELLNETLGSYTFEELEQNVRSQKAGEIQISPERQESCQKLSEVREELSAAMASQAQLQGLLKGREESCRPAGQVEAELLTIRKKCEGYQLELAAVALAKEKLIGLSGQLHRDFAPKLNQRISEALKKVTNGRYSKVVIDQTLSVKLEDQETGKLVETSSLSSGMADLVYLVMRRELVHLLCRQGEKEVAVPLIFDDSFTQLDDERTARFLSFLLFQQEEQILIFTCHTRERDILTKAGIEYNFVPLKR